VKEVEEEAYDLEVGKGKRKKRQRKRKGRKRRSSRSVEVVGEGRLLFVYFIWICNTNCDNAFSEPQMRV